MPTQINFVIYGWDKWHVQLTHKRACIGSLAPAIRSNEDAWIVLTYFQLAVRGLEATVSDRPLPDHINILDGISLPQLPPSDVYCVGCRSDGHYPGVCRLVIHQNVLTEPDWPAIYIPQWTQPGLIPRDPARTGINNIGFLGHPEINLARAFKEPQFLHALQQVGCRLVIRGKTGQQVLWNDYSDLDLILSVRDIPPGHLKLKPVNKLTNAWAAGVPALIGSEPAVEAIRVSPLDYVPVNTPADVLHALDAFRRNGNLYQHMIDHGRARAKAYSDDAVAGRWFEAIEMIRQDHARWQRGTALERWLDYHRRVARHRRGLKRHDQTVHAGYKRLGYGTRWWASGEPLTNP